MNQPFDSNNPWANNSRGLGFNGYNDPYRQTPMYGTGMNYQRPSIPGRPVNNLDEITPQEVPMDGSVSLFPQNDYSVIYAKTCNESVKYNHMRFIV